MAEVKREFLDGPYGQIHARIARNGGSDQPPVLLLHMFPQSSRIFAEALELIGSSRTAAAADFPGYGESDVPSEPITAEDYASAMWQAAEGLGLLTNGQKLDLFGLHGGSKVAVEMAAQRPDDVGHIVVASAALLDSGQVERIRNAFVHIPLDKAGSRFVKFWEMLTRNAAPETSLATLAQQYAEMVRSGESYGWGNLALLDYNEKFPARLEGLPHDVDLINPGDDLFKPTRSSSHLFSGHYVEREDWTLGFTQEKPDEFAELLIQLLERQSIAVAAE